MMTRRQQQFDYKRVRIRLEELEREHKWLAEETGYSCNYISYLLNGRRNPSTEALKKIASALKVPEGSLLRKVS